MTKMHYLGRYTLLAAVLALATTACTLAGSTEADLLAEAERDLDWLKGIRRELHKIPELKYEEVKTSEFVRKELDKLGIPYRYPVAETGIVGTIGTGSPKFALRADMDGLLITEENTDEWRSTHEGKCHCCSHDSHMTMLLGAAKMLKARESELPGTVVLLFQPAEEGGAGAQRMVQEGALEGVAGVFGEHAWPTMRSGLVASRAGTIMAATDKFVVTIRGKGGHGGIPQAVQDAVVAASMAVVALQPLISRELSPTDSAIIGITRFNTGPGSNNIHPDAVELNGTLNHLTSAGLEELRARFVEVIEGTVALYKCTASFRWPQITYPATVNDAALVGLVEGVAKKMVGPERWVTAPASSMAAEDFAWLAEAVPGAYVWLGTGNKEGTSAGVHTPIFQMDDSQLPLGAALHVAVALEFLTKHSTSGLKEEL